jgi:hypothetical protein
MLHCLIKQCNYAFAFLKKKKKQNKTMLKDKKKKKNLGEPLKPGLPLKLAIH